MQYHSYSMLLFMIIVITAINNNSNDYMIYLIKSLKMKTEKTY